MDFEVFLAISAFFCLAGGLTDGQGIKPEEEGKFVFAAQINPSGYSVGDVDYEDSFQVDIDQSSTSVNEMTVCLWLNPYRFRDSCQILAIYEVCSHCFSWDADFILKMVEDVITIDGFPQFNQSLSPYQWHHICILYGEDGLVFVDQVKFKLTSEGTVKPLNFNSPLMVSLGADNIMEYSFSGMVADVRIYFRLISEMEVANISKFQDVETDYKTLSMLVDESSELNETHFSSNYFIPYLEYLYKQPKSNKFYLMSPQELLKEVSEKFVTKFEDPVSCSVARETCPNFGGYTPFYENESDLEELYEMIWEYMMISMQNVRSFWLLHKSGAVESCVKAVVNSNLHILRIINDSSIATQTLTSLCVLHRNQTFYLKFGSILKPVIHIPNSFHVYEGVTSGRRCKWSEAAQSLELINVDYGTLIAKRIEYNIHEILGRSRWDSADGSNNFLMIFSICIEGQFTCDSGQCIDISLACDYHTDCGDGSDESFCDVGIIPEYGYEKRLAPIHDAPKYKLFLNLTLFRVDSISMEDNTIKLSLFLNVEWSDVRLSFKYLADNESRYIHQSTLKHIWNPRIIIPEGSTDSDKETFYLDTNFGSSTATKEGPGTETILDSYEILKYEGKNVKITTDAMASLVLNCWMDLYQFPFDEQDCQFTLYLEGIIKQDIEWDPKSIVAIQDGEKNLALYNIQNLSYTIQPDKRNELRVTLSLKRKNGAYILNTFLPCSILELIGLFTLFLPHDDYQDRVTATLSCLIVMASLFTQVSSSLPTSADPKIIDIWMFSHIGLLFLIFLVHIIIIMLHHKITTNKNTEKNKTEDFSYESYLASKLGVKGDGLRPITAREAWKFGPGTPDLSDHCQRPPLYVKMNYFGIVLYVSCYAAVLLFFFHSIEVINITI